MGFKQHLEGTMKVTKFLTKDHDEVRDLFQQYARSRSVDDKQEIALKVFAAITVHSEIEEETFYPAFDEAAGEDEDASMVEEARKEHAIVKAIIDLLKSTEPGKEFEEKFKELRENIEHHADEEEDEMFPRAEKLLRGRLDELGDQMEDRKQQLMRREMAGAATHP